MYVGLADNKIAPHTSARRIKVTNVQRVWRNAGIVVVLLAYVLFMFWSVDGLGKYGWAPAAVALIAIETGALILFVFSVMHSALKDAREKDLLDGSRESPPSLE